MRADGEPGGGGYDPFVVKGIAPIVDLLTVEVVMTGRPAGVIKSDLLARPLVAMVGDGDVISVSLTDAFRDALTSLDREYLEDVAQGWARSGCFSTPPDADSIAAHLRPLGALAERAVARGHGLYRWICQYSAPGPRHDTCPDRPQKLGQNLRTDSASTPVREARSPPTTRRNVHEQRQRSCGPTGPTGPGADWAVRG